MQTSLQVLFLIIFNFSICGLVFGQVEIHTGSVQFSFTISETTTIIDKATGAKVSYEDYQRLVKEDQRAFSLEPVINEYGQPGSYLLRRTTKEEHDTGRISELNIEDRPKSGEKLPLVVLKGMDGKEYRSTDLKGKIVVLGFWLTFKRPFWDAKRTKEFEDIVKPYGESVISLGIVQSSKQEVMEALTNGPLPFIPIPDSYGFHKKFVVATIPSFVVVNKEGNVVAYIEGTEVDELKKALITASK